ncbi:MAG: DUF2905 domain-containing protein [Thermodesulfobacteriota bacterium]
MARNLVILGLLLVLVGLAWPLLSRLPLGRLPGDIVIRRDSFTFFFPVTTGVLLSLFATLLFWLLRK